MANRKRKKYNKQSTKQAHKPKDQVTQTPLKIVGELRHSEGVSSSICRKQISLVELFGRIRVVCFTSLPHTNKGTLVSPVVLI
jgi:hypothetical protein